MKNRCRSIYSIGGSDVMKNRCQSI